MASGITPEARVGAVDRASALANPKGRAYWLLVVLVVFLGLPRVALAAPRTLQDAYAVAMRQFNELDLESATETVDRALRRAEDAGTEDGPALASLHALRGGLIHAETGDRERAMVALRRAVRADHQVSLPIEMRSAELLGLLEEARADVPPPASAITHGPPPAPPPSSSSSTGASEVSPEAVRAGARPKRRRPTHWSRVFLDLGVGTGIGLAYGAVEQTYVQYNPSKHYGDAEGACALARWYAGDGPLAADSTVLAQGLASEQIQTGDPATLDAYDAASCAQRHPVTVGPASAPLHLAPQFAVRIHERTIGRRSLALLVGGFGRLQVVTGSRVYTEDPTQTRAQSFRNEVHSTLPRGYRRRLGFTWAAGGKIQALIAKRGGALHGMVGLFGGYGHSRLRIDMGFSNDRNGNSVPDELEVSRGSRDDRGSGSECIPVWPYEQGCVPGSDHGQVADIVRKNSGRRDRRVDTIRLGPVFAGILAGLRYQPREHIGVFAEVHVGGWFPDRPTLLVDINVGPSITF